MTNKIIRGSELIDEKYLKGLPRKWYLTRISSRSCDLVEKKSFLSIVTENSDEAQVPSIFQGACLFTQWALPDRFTKPLHSKLPNIVNNNRYPEARVAAEAGPAPSQEEVLLKGHRPHRKTSRLAFCAKSMTGPFSTATTSPFQCYPLNLSIRGLFRPSCGALNHLSSFGALITFCGRTATRLCWEKTETAREKARPFAPFCRHFFTFDCFFFRTRVPQIYFTVPRKEGGVLVYITL